MTEKDLVFIQDQIGYNFKNVDLLQQAFVRRSYSIENGGENNEVLEFIGDKVLDLVVVKLLVEKYGYFLSQCEDYDPNAEFEEFACEEDESTLTELKQMLVQKKTLANRIDILMLSDKLIMGKGDTKKNINDETSVKEDLFEAILGAVALDCNWDINELECVVEVMLAPNSIIEDIDEDNYVAYIQDWTLRKYNTFPNFHFEKTSQVVWFNPFKGVSDIFIDDYVSKNMNHTCLVKLTDNLPIFRAFGSSKNDARKAVCKKAYEYLQENNLLLSIRDELDNPNKDDAISQLEILARRGYFSIPTYDFSETYDNDGNPIWKCECNITEENITFQANSSTKKEAKKLAAYEMLMHVLK